jgi:hypothetical protein
MREALGLGPEARVFEHSFCYWKYWQPNPFWEGSRSYLLEQGNRIVAHICAWPMQLHWGTNIVPSLHLLDWAGSRDVRGAGKQVLKSLFPFSSIWTDWGGREVTKKSLRAFGFQPLNSFWTFVRYLRPLQQARSYLKRDWLLPARYVRNTLWALRPSTRLPAGWEYREAAPEEIPSDLWPQSIPGQSVSGRTAAWYKYVMTCPVTTFRLYLLLRAGKPRGYFCLAFVPGQARLVDYSLAQMNPEGCAALIAAAEKEALKEQDCCELLAGVTEPELVIALRSAHFRLFNEQPLKAYYVGSDWQDMRYFRLTLIDSDAGFIY